MPAHDDTTNDDTTNDDTTNDALTKKIMRFPWRPRLISAGTGEPLSPVSRIGPAPIQPGEGEHWTCALDLLKELIHDIETGRLEVPTQIYVAMETEHPTEPALKVYPSCAWSGQKSGSFLAYVGLLSLHKFLLQNR